MHILNIVLLVFILILIPIAIYFRPIFIKNNWKIRNLKKDQPDVNIVIEELKNIRTKESIEIIDLLRSNEKNNKIEIVNILNRNLAPPKNKLALYIVLGFFESKNMKKFKLSKRKGQLLLFLNKIQLAVVMFLLIIWYFKLSGTETEILMLIENITIKHNE